MVGGRVYCGAGECCQFPEIIIVEISWAAKFCVGGVVGRVKLFFIAEGRNFGRVRRSGERTRRKELCEEWQGKKGKQFLWRLFVSFRTVYSRLTNPQLDSANCFVCVTVPVRKGLAPKATLHGG